MRRSTLRLQKKAWIKEEFVRNDLTIDPYMKDRDATISLLINNLIVQDVNVIMAVWTPHGLITISMVMLGIFFFKYMFVEISEYARMFM